MDPRTSSTSWSAKAQWGSHHDCDDSMKTPRRVFSKVFSMSFLRSESRTPSVLIAARTFQHGSLSSRLQHQFSPVKSGSPVCNTGSWPHLLHPGEHLVPLQAWKSAEMLLRLNETQKKQSPKPLFYHFSDYMTPGFHLFDTLLLVFSCCCLQAFSYLFFLPLKIRPLAPPNVRTWSPSGC